MLDFYSFVNDSELLHLMLSPICLFNVATFEGSTSLFKLNKNFGGKLGH